MKPLERKNKIDNIERLLKRILDEAKGLDSYPVLTDKLIKLAMLCSPKNEFITVMRNEEDDYFHWSNIQFNNPDRVPSDVMDTMFAFYLLVFHSDANIEIKTLLTLVEHGIKILEVYKEEFEKLEEF